VEIQRSHPLHYIHEAPIASNQSGSSSISTRWQGTLQVPKWICTHPEVLSAPAPERRMHRRFADVIGALLSSAEHILKACRQVQNTGRAVLAREEVKRGDRQCKQPTACAMCMHVPATYRQNVHHYAPPSTSLQVPQRRARWAPTRLKTLVASLTPEQSMTATAN
jgi:hypothetical protein